MQTIQTKLIYWRIDCNEPMHAAAPKWKAFADRMLADHAAMHEHFGVVADYYVMGSISPERIESIQWQADNVARKLKCKAVRVGASDVFPNG